MRAKKSWGVAATWEPLFDRNRFTIAATFRLPGTLINGKSRAEVIQKFGLLLATMLLCAAAPVRSAGAEQPYGPLRPSEVPWRIAGQTYSGTKLGRDQLMLALLATNPDAVVPLCDVNGILRVGAVLVLPTPERIPAQVPDATRCWTAAMRTNEWATYRYGEMPLERPGPATEVKLDIPTISKPLPERPCLAPPETCAACSDQQDQVLSPKEQASAATPRLTPGPRAPVWLLVPLLLGLIAAALVDWEQHQRDGSAEPVSATDADTLERLPARAALRLALGPMGLHLLLVLAALAGILGAGVTVLFREAIHGLEWLLDGNSGSLVAIAESLPAWQRLLLPGVGGLIAGLILQEIGSRLRGPKTTDYIAAVAAGDGWISVRHSLVKAASSLFTVASGGSIGREGAMVQISAMVASSLGRLGRFPPDRLRLLVAAGAAAGLASAYNAPLAATMFVAEIVLGSIALEHIGPLVVAAVVAGVTVHDILGYAPVYQIPQFRLVSDWELSLYLVLGLVAGHVAPFFLRLLERAHHDFAKLPLPLAGRLALGGLIVGAISAYEPQIWGNGYSVVNTVLQDSWPWQALLTVLILKMVATAATHGSGAIGGAFTPTLFVGALLGALFGTLVQALLPAGTASPNAYAVVGMGAMLAGTTHAPFMSILMIFEMTMDYEIVLPLMLAVVTAHYTAQRYTGVSPMYAESLLPREPTDPPGEAQAR